MGNCLTILVNLQCKKFLRHTVSIHPLINAQKQSPNHPGYGVQPFSGNFSGKMIVLDRKTERLELYYDLGRELGRGQFGVIRHCTSKITGEELACKSIEKRRLTNPGDAEDVRREIQVLERLSCHPNIVELKAVYEDLEFVHLVMELCEGGELFDRIIEKKAFSEAEAAKVLKTLMEVVQYCHGHGILHRDLKPENILLATREASSPIKVADFGLARCFKPDNKFSEMAGSAYYIAPEVLRGEYGEAIDVWSAGIVLYILLTGVPPFWDETEEGIFEAIRIGNFDLSCDPWTSISSAAKELVKGMICPDVEKRLTPEQVLNSPWILSHSSSSIDIVDEVSSVNEKIAVPLLLLKGSDPNTVGDPCSVSSYGSSFWQEDSNSETSNFDFETSNSPSEEGGLLLSTKSLCLSLRSSSVGSNIDNAQETLDESPRDSTDGSSSTCSSPDCAVLERWTSFTELAEPTFCELLSSVVSHLADLPLQLPTDQNKVQLQDGSAYTIVKTTCDKDTVLLQTNNGKFLVVHDREQRRIGWTDMADEDVPNLIGCDPSRLLWSPCCNPSIGLCRLQQPQSQSQSQPQPQPQLAY